MNASLTERQRKLLAFIVDHTRGHGHPPTVREIGAAFRFHSTGTVRDHLRALVKKGYLRTIPGKSRGLIPRTAGVGRSGPWAGIPLLGRVPAGGPLLAEENVDSFLDLSRDFGGERVFALKVTGDSMVGAGICEGDLVVVRAQAHADPGQIVVALIDGEATVKTLTRRRNGLWLEPANPRYEPLPVAGETRVVGRVIGVIRSYERRF